MIQYSVFIVNWGCCMLDYLLLGQPVASGRSSSEVCALQPVDSADGSMSLKPTLSHSFHKKGRESGWQLPFNFCQWRTDLRMLLLDTFWSHCWSHSLMLTKINLCVCCSPLFLTANPAYTYWLSKQGHLGLLKTLWSGSGLRSEWPWVASWRSITDMVHASIPTTFCLYCWMPHR